jgi:hypothetical protein
VRPGANGTVTSWPAFFAACSTRRIRPGRSGRRANHLPLVGSCAVEVLLDLLEGLQRLGKLRGVVHLPVALWRHTDRAPFAPPRLSVPRKVAAAAQAAETSRPTESPESRILAFSAAMSCSSTSSPRRTARMDGATRIVRGRRPFWQSACQDRHLEAGARQRVLDDELDVLAAFPSADGLRGPNSVALGRGCGSCRASSAARPTWSTLVWSPRRRELLRQAACRSAKIYRLYPDIERAAIDEALDGAAAARNAIGAPDRWLNPVPTLRGVLRGTREVAVRLHLGGLEPQLLAVEPPRGLGRPREGS